MFNQLSAALKRRGYWGVSVAVAAIGLASLAGRSAEAEAEFSDGSVAGVWSYVGEFGLIVPPAAPEASPATTVGVMHLDGSGGCSAHGFVNVLGDTVETDTIECSYSVEADGFGSMEATFSNAPIAEPFPFVFVISNHGREIHFMNTRFVVGTFTARRR